MWQIVYFRDRNLLCRLKNVLLLLFILFLLKDTKFNIKNRIHFLLTAAPTNWPCEVLIVPERPHSQPIISHKSMRGGKTSDRQRSYCLLIAGVGLLIMFCIPHWSRNLSVEEWIRHNRATYRLSSVCFASSWFYVSSYWLYIVQAQATPHIFPKFLCSHTTSWYVDQYADHAKELNVCCIWAQQP